jgi:hypothetical protein
MGAGCVGDIGVNLDAGDVSVIADNVLNQCGVVARSAANFQHVVAGAQMKLL